MQSWIKYQEESQIVQHAFRQIAASWKESGFLLCSSCCLGRISIQLTAQGWSAEELKRYILKNNKKWDRIGNRFHYTVHSSMLFMLILTAFSEVHAHFLISTGCSHNTMKRRPWIRAALFWHWSYGCPVSSRSCAYSLHHRKKRPQYTIFTALKCLKSKNEVC